VTGGALAWALVTAVAFGAADFLGGMASRRAPVLAVVLVSQVLALVLLALVSPFAGAGPSAAALGWGAAAGVAAGFAFLAYYRGLAIGRMGVVSTMAAIWSAVVPLVVGVVVGGERPSAPAVAGAVVAVVAIALLAATPLGEGVPAPGSRGGWPGLGEGVAAGIGFGLFLVFVERAGPGPPVWPLLAAAAGTTAVVGALAAWRRVDVAAVRGHLTLVAGAGAFGVLGGMAVLLAVRDGLLSLVAVVAALSPVPTIVLARLVLHEHLRGRHLLGVALALAGVALIAGG
jgi:drug/metabolite transporter (DMT)-like permease